MTISDVPLAQEFTKEEEKRISAQLSERLSPNEILHRQTGGGMAPYVEGHTLCRIANKVFGFNGWTTRLVQSETDYLDVEQGRISAGVHCIVRITLKDGSFHEDVGYGICENVKTKGMALEKARKEAATDALKRCLRLFGEKLGNCCYDKEFTATLSQKPNAPQNGYKQQSGYQQHGKINSKY